MLSELKAALETVPPDWTCWLKTAPNEDMVPVRGLISWRGVYAQASVDWVAGGDAAVFVDVLLGQVAAALDGVPLQGYKGGDYVMDGETPVWADPYGMYNGRIVTGYTTSVGSRFILDTYLIPSEYR